MSAERAKELTAEQEKVANMTVAEMRANVIRLVFGGDEKRFEVFCNVLSAELPPGTVAVLRGSSVTGVRWDDGAPFDADGPGTSDMDLTLIGDEVHKCYILDGYFLPGIHSKPLSDEDPDIAPDLVPLRDRLMSLVNRPVNIQATRDFVMYIREHLMEQPFLTLVESEKAEEK